MKVLILGVDGYLGWTLAVHLLSKGHEVAGADNFSRRALVSSSGGDSAIPIADMAGRLSALRDVGKHMRFYEHDVAKCPDCVRVMLREERPDVIVHLAEQPSAPYSMASQGQCISTQSNNVVGTLNVLWAMRDLAPDVHLIKLGTMGEYGTPKVPIPEGYFDLDYRGHKDFLPFPRQPGSFYHASKVFDSINISLACKFWGLTCTDVMQGVVYGTHIEAMTHDQRMHTRFDFDQSFGTAINRFCAQAVLGLPITPYGTGGQKRGFLPLQDSMNCIELLCENSPMSGAHLVVNQFHEAYTLRDIAQLVFRVAGAMGMDTRIECVQNPRKEAEDHMYEPDRNILPGIGYEPSTTVEQGVESLLKSLLPWKDRMRRFAGALDPTITWERGAPVSQIVAASGQQGSKQPSAPRQGDHANVRPPMHGAVDGQKG